MNRISKKLKSQSGASLIIALVLLLVCVMVGSVILSSAAGNADKMRKRESEQQEYLALSSAAELIRTSLGGTVYSAWENNTVYQCYGYYDWMSPDKHTDVADVCDEMTYEKNDDAGLKADIADVVYTAYRSHTKYYAPTIVPSEIEKEFTVSSADTDIPDVKVKMIFNTQTYGTIFYLTIAENAVSDYALTLRFNPVVISPNKGSVNEQIEYIPNSDKHWVLEIVKTDEGDKEVEVERGFDVTIYTLNTTVAYDSGTITKGVTTNA